MRSRAGGRWRGARLGLVAVRGVVASMLALACCREEGAEGTKPAPLSPVQVMPVVKADIPVEQVWNATIEGSNTAEIRAPVEGYLMAILYRQGSYVEAGAPLFQLDDRRYRQDLLVAQGRVDQARASLEKARGDVRRYAPLVSTGAASGQELAHAEAERDAALAQIAAGRAAVRAAEIQLSFTRVVAPIDGVAGIVNVEIGALVEPQTTLTTISTLDPIRVRFAISELQYLEAASILQRITLAGPEASSEEPEEHALSLVLANGVEYPYAGAVIRVGLAIDPGTGTLPIEAQFPNPELLLRPGQFASIRLRTGEGRGALVIPQRALTELQGIEQVAVVDPKAHVVSMRRVQVGPRVGALAIIERGVRAGELVVVEGLQGLSDGARVEPRRAPPIELPDSSAAGAGGRPPASSKGGR